MKLDYELNMEDIIQYYLHMSHTSLPFKKVVRRRQVRFFIILFILFIIYSLLWPVTNQLFYYVLSAVISLAGAYLYSFYIFFRIGRSLRKFHSKGRGGLYGKKIVEITELGVTDQTDESDPVKYEWRTIKEVYIRKLYVFIHVNALTVILIPRRAFAGNDAWKQFIDKLKSFQAEGRGRN